MGRITLMVPIFCFFVVLASCHFRGRRSGISDQRLAEIETLLAIENSQKGNNNVAYGVIDPMALGKRKRSYDKDIMPVELENFPVEYLRESRLKLPYFRHEVLAYPRRLPSRLYNIFRPNDLENGDLQTDDDLSK
ncbi:uncharacterized protein LOC118196861 [Stegodyphus dumicola]|uniref:uncharacterized protein LOC118196861 n=1 Tax=Stegodyphus dumicola TaxID=202533 RepID=UPI0015ABF35C|nr:uncharacterized protein LOC118196861 [Stegodyphus dumicola]